MTSGAINPGLPQATLRLSVSYKSVARPKSVIDTPISDPFFEEMRTLAGFISL